ncbi:MAG: purine-nucleoside phosphorylase [Chlorobi bacterium]|nr:purine-nucleoside phosphorylase [Chlorobiota bacterium]
MSKLNPENLYDKARETADHLLDLTEELPEYGIVLGSGLGSLSEDIDIDLEVRYEHIPNFPVSTVEGHKGSLIFGWLAGKYVMAMNGRFHYYEGYNMYEVTFPERVMKLMGINKLIVSNASGGVNRDYKIGDVMIIRDHINFFPEHPLRGKNDERFGPRFVNMSEPYSRKMIEVVETYARSRQIPFRKGVYLGLQGPTFETIAEYNMVRVLGADAVGMSTVPEVIVAKHMDMEVFGISVITDIDDPDLIQSVNHEEVMKEAKKAEPVVRDLVQHLVKTY